MEKIHIVSSGTPTPTPKRFGTCYVLQTDDDFLMFDCGPAATHKLVKVGIFPTQVEYLFFTHHHFDHNSDYPCFLLCRWDQSIGKESVLKVRGPSPTEWITERLFGNEGAFSHDWKARVGHPGSQQVFLNRGGTLPRPAPSVDAEDVKPGEILKTDQWKVSATHAKHMDPFLETLAYRVDTPNSSVVFTSDCGLCESVVELAKGTHTIVVNCWDHQNAMDTAVSSSIAGTIEAGQFAKKAGAKTLILTHQGANLCQAGSREKAVSDISKLFGGVIIFAEELMTIEL